jgi:DNA invertase Pin-like site-specific DNA recombinase
MGHAGIVMGLEVSRLARKSSDWHRLLEICALTSTLILDEDGVYDPSHFNDRMLLGMKGTMSEAELHVLRARLNGGMLNKARRGELRTRLPVGFEYDQRGRVVLCADKAVREAVRLIFDTYQRVGSAHATVRHFRKQGLRAPKRLHSGPSKGEVVWRELSVNRVVEILHNPRYAGAYAWGRRTSRRNPANGRVTMEHLPRDRWRVLIPGAHKGYISWEEYEENQKRLKESAKARNEHRRCPPREGPALLQGLAICGVCGRKMTVRYHNRRGSLNPDYVCQGPEHLRGGPRCQTVPGHRIDEAVGRLVVELMEPRCLELALAVQEELQAQAEEADRLRFRQVERARYEADLARRRYTQVDPENRLVADELEAEWNAALRAARQAEEEYQRARETNDVILDDEKRSRVLALARDFPRVWNDPQTPNRERKRMIRLLIEDATITKNGTVALDIRFRGGRTRSLTLPRALPSWKERITPQEVVSEIDRLLDDHTESEVAELLNGSGRASGWGRSFDACRVGVVRRAYKLKSRRDRLRERGLLSLDEAAKKLGLSKWTVKKRRNAGTLDLACVKLNDVGEYMYEADASVAKKSKTSACAEEV